MNDRPDLAKLPKYAQNYIRCVERERDEAIEKCNRLTDHQTKSNIWVEDYGVRGNRCREYVQGDSVVIQNGDVSLRVSARRPESIELSWCEGDELYGIGDVALIPTAYQQARLVNCKNMHSNPIRMNKK